MSRSPEAISILSIVESVEGKINLMNCFDHPENCRDANQCSIMSVLHTAQAALVTNLRNSNLKLMVKAKNDPFHALPEKHFLKPQFAGKLISVYPADDDAALYLFHLIVSKYGWAWMDKYNPGGNQGDANYVYGYGVAFLMHETLKRCGDTLTRENVMKQAASFQKFKVPVLLPGITISTSPTDFYPIQAVQLARFKGETWELFGDIMAAEST